jgi:hypothetical protein
VCLVAEESQDRKAMIVTNFDPVRGRGAELARFELNNPANIGDSVEHVLLFDISPDGNRLAVSRSEQGPIEIRSLHGKQGFVGGDHLNADGVVEHARRLRADGALKPNGRVFATHIAHEGNPPHPELVAFAKQHGYEVAHDGLILTI